MRIVGGNLKGLGLAAVGKGDAAAHLRPTSDRVRESIFNLLQNGGYSDVLIGARVLDMFAGTGALGLEALSRGASKVTFVETGRKSQHLIRQNIGICRAKVTASLINRDATRLGLFPSDQGEKFDLVFLDPPYGKLMGERALSAAQHGGWLADGALIIWEENSEKEPPTGFARLDMRRYGETFIHVLRLGG